MMRPMAAALCLSLLGFVPHRAPVRPAAPMRPGSAATRLRLVLAPDGNAARFRVREQLAQMSLPNEAVGVTSGITGAIVLVDGKVVPAESKITVDLTTLKSDRDRRDGYIKRRTLETDRFPTAELVPAALPGLPSPLPSSGPMTFQIVGDLTIHGVTRTSTWQVTAEAKDGGFTGIATTRVKFEDFGMVQPRVAIVLSVEDDIGLEYQFHLMRDSTSR